MVSFVGNLNPNWKGGKLPKNCEICGKFYEVPVHRKNSRFCSLQCTGIFQRGRGKPSNKRKPYEKVVCLTCNSEFMVPPSHVGRKKCCSIKCGRKFRSTISTGRSNPNWNGGLSRIPYPYNFTRLISKKIKERDGYACQNPKCSGADKRLTTHHINYVKEDCRDENLICLCSSCNSKANFDRPKWQSFYEEIVARKSKSGWWDTTEVKS